MRPTRDRVSLKARLPLCAPLRMLGMRLGASQGRVTLLSPQCHLNEGRGKAVLCPWTQKGAPLIKLPRHPVCSTEAIPRASERSPPSLLLLDQVAIGAEGKAVRVQGALASAHCWVREPLGSPLLAGSCLWRRSRGMDGMPSGGQGSIAAVMQSLGS